MKSVSSQVHSWKEQIAKLLELFLLSRQKLFVLPYSLRLHHFPSDSDFNCFAGRFLQSPDGITSQGAPRKYTDGAAAWHMRTHINSGKESQSSLINYKKGGTPFINLVTMCVFFLPEKRRLRGWKSLHLAP